MRILTVDDDILGLGEIQRLKFKIETYKSEKESIKRSNRIRNKKEILEHKSLKIKELEKLLNASEKASQEADMAR